MPEEEAEYLEDIDNEENGKNSSNSSSKSSLGNVASNIVDFSSHKNKKNKDANNKSNNTSNIIDFDKYKSKKNNFTDGENNNASNASNAINNNHSIGSGFNSGLKNRAANAVFNKVSNLHPALKALNTANNIRNMVVRRNASSTTGSNNSDNNTNDVESSSGITSDVTSSDVDNGVDGESENISLNPLSRIFGSNNGFSGKFSFIGKMPLALKIGIMFAGPLFAIFFIFLIPVTVIGYFSGFWEIDSVLASSGGAGDIDYGDYQLSSDGDEILHQSLDSFLESQGSSIEEFNNLITSNIEEAGYGTRAGVVASAVTLIAELGNNYNVKVPYFWGGGHGIVAEGAESNWGSNSCHTYANGQSYNYCGLDCSGFVTWAIRNGGFNINPLVTGGFQSLNGARRVTLSNSAVLQAGDLLESSGHVILIVDVDDDAYICAEAAGNETGVLFSRHEFNSSGYWGVDMDGFYSSMARS